MTIDRSGQAVGEPHRWAVLLDRLTTFWRVIGLTSLWLVSVAPLVTVGPATLAFMAVVRDDVQGRPRPVVRAFFAYLKENARLGLALSVLTIGPVAALLLLDPRGASPLVASMWLVALVGTVAAVPLLVHGYPMAAHTHQSLRTLYRDCVVLTAGRPGATMVGLLLLVVVGTAVAQWPIVLPVLGYLAARGLFLSFRRAWSGLSSSSAVDHDGGAARGRGRQLHGII